MPFANARLALLLAGLTLFVSVVLVPYTSARQRTDRVYDAQNFAFTGAVTTASSNTSVYLPFIRGASQSTATASPSPTLLASYVIRPYPEYQAARYTPRAMTAPPYAGWDRLSLPGQFVNDGINTTMSNADWLTLMLNRPATLAIVWRGVLDPPAWLRSWSQAENVAIDGHTYPTYRKTFPTGTVTLGGVNDPGDTTSQPTYLVLFAEADGTPSPAPAVPDGKETPQPNQPCPQWVHDQYVTTGPDGKLYPTWHPQIDPVYWCYFQHDHGSDPSLVTANYKPAYGYTAATAGESEPHAGFKTYVLDDRVGHWWIITHHFGTGSIRRACVRFHTVDTAVVDKTSHELLADLHLMGDFGKSVVNKTGEALTPTTCPDQAATADAEGSTGARMIPVATRDSVGYEPWRLDASGNILGFNAAGLTFNTPAGLTICNDVTCDQPVATGTPGVFRFLSFDTGFGVTAVGNTNTFYTADHGKTRVNREQAGAAQQYIKPGLDISAPRSSDTEEFYPTEPWRMMYLCSVETPASSNMNLEGALSSPN